MAPRPTSPRRTTRTAAVAAFVAVAAACGGPATTPASDANIATVTASTAPPSETEQPGPPDCSQARLAADLGALGHATCEGEWAAVQPRNYTDACIDCETIWLARWSGTSWGLRARCHALVVLTPAEHGCTAVAGTFATETDAGELRDFPPAETACAIWGFNTVEESLATTGCPEQ